MKRQQIKTAAAIAGIFLMLVAGLTLAGLAGGQQATAPTDPLGLVQEQVGDLFLDVDGDGDLDYVVEAWIIRNDPAVGPSAPEPAPVDPTPAP